MDQWIARRNIAALKQRLSDGKVHENDGELRRQLAEQEALLRRLNDPLKGR
jgi:hypothetical protein